LGSNDRARLLITAIDRVENQRRFADWLSGTAEISTTSSRAAFLLAGGHLRIASPCYF